MWIVFFGTILLWATEQATGINSNVVALIPLGILTACGIFTKEDIKEINWSVLWLVAGGFALGTCLQGTGLAKVLIEAIPFGNMNIIAVFIVAGLVCYFLSNFISNSATAALLIPILIVVATAMEAPEAASHDAFVALGGTQAMISFIAVCASIAMLLPISTPPNAIASSTGMVATKDMAKVGLIIGVVGFVLGFFWLTKIFPFDVAAPEAIDAAGCRFRFRLPTRRNPPRPKPSRSTSRVTCRYTVSSATISPSIPARAFRVQATFFTMSRRTWQ